MESRVYLDYFLLTWELAPSGPSQETRALDLKESMCWLGPSHSEEPLYSLDTAPPVTHRSDGTEHHSFIHSLIHSARNMNPVLTRRPTNLIKKTDYAQVEQ